MFYEKNDIFETDEYLSNNYAELVKKFDVPVGHLMFQLATLFTYHHELGHLIQKLTPKSYAFHFLGNEEEINSLTDLKEVYST